MEIQFSPADLALIEEKVASAEDPSAAAVVHQALRILQERDRGYGDWLREAVRAGEATIAEQGMRVPDAGFWADVRARYQSGGD